MKSSGQASAVGLIRDNKGVWVGVFLANIGSTSFLHAELRGVKDRIPSSSFGAHEHCGGGVPCISYFFFADDLFLIRLKGGQPCHKQMWSRQ